MAICRGRPPAARRMLICCIHAANLSMTVAIDTAVCVSDAGRRADARDELRQKRVEISGVQIDNVTMCQAFEQIERLIARASPAYIVTPNVDHVVKLQRNAAFGSVYQGAALVLADGMPLLWAARFLGTPLKQKVSGSDLFPRFCQLAAERGYRLFFLGGQPGAAERAASVLAERHPDLRVVGTYCPPMRFEHDDEENERIIRMLNESRPDVVFVGVGAPKQELWIARHHKRYAAAVSIGVGASFDFVAGYVRRAPRVVQRLGLEWLWRLAQEPRRMHRRYLIDDPKFFALVWRQWHKQRRASSFELVRNGESSRKKHSAQRAGDGAPAMKSGHRSGIACPSGDFAGLLQRITGTR
jgi:N-acetylglucosaminyldiphosphoundecaprenol N-acetyl-beta-D-mannosaminyltransferase